MSWGKIVNGIPWSRNVQSSNRQKSIYKKEELIDLSSFQNIDDEFSLVTSYLSESAPLSIDLLLQGSNIKVLKGDRYYAVTSTEGKIVLVDSKEQLILKDAVVCQDSGLIALAITPDDKSLFIGGADNKIYKYSIESFKEEQVLEGHSGTVNSIAINLSNEWMVSASDDGTVKFWSLKEGTLVKDLINHSAPVRCIDLSSNSTFIATASEDTTCVIYETLWAQGEESGRVLTTLQANHALNTVKFSYSNRIVVTGDSKGEIIIWSFNDWNIAKVYREKAAVNSIDISIDETLMITGGDNKQVYIWHIQSEAERPSLSLEGYDAPIRSLCLTNDQQFIVTISDDCKAVRWRIPYFESIKKLVNCDAVELKGVGDSLVGISSRRVDYWDTLGKKINSYPVPAYHKYLITHDNFLYLFIQTQVSETLYNYRIQVFNLTNFTEQIPEFQVSAGQMISVTLSRDKTYLSIGSVYNITTFQLGEKPMCINSQLYHDGDVHNICITPSSEFLFSTGPNEDKQVIKQILIKAMTDDKLKNEVAEISDLGGKVNDFVCTDDSKKLLIVTESKFLLWSISQCTMIRSVHINRPLRKIHLQPQQGYFFTQHDNGIDIWDFSDFEMKSSLVYKAIQTFAFFNNSETMAVKYKGKSECFESPLTTRHVKIIGENVNDLERDFFKYVRKISFGKSVEFDHRFHNWMIMPFKITIQHIYAYYAHEDFLRQSMLCLKSGIQRPDAPYVKSANKHTILSVSLEQKFPECAKIAIKSMKARLSTNPYSMITVTDSLINLNKSGIDGLNKLYEFAFRPHFFDNLPNFIADVELPLISYSKSIEVDQETLLGTTANTMDGTAVVFEHSSFEMYMTLGSSSSIQFMDSLIKCKNETIFETRLIKLMLEQKWREARVIMYLQASLYLFYLGTLTWYATVQLYNKDFLVLPAGFSIALTLYESYQMYSGQAGYFKDIWNWIDIARSCLFFAYALMVWFGVILSDSDFLILIILASWIRGLTYFRIFNQLRYLINLIFEVFKDIPAFLIIFFYTIIAFSFIFYALGNPDAYYWPLLIRVYSTTIGNNGFDELGKLQWLFYVMITLFNFIIMLNLLISILSDTYSRVKDTQEVADGKELAKMILEVELMMFWRSNDDSTRFVHYVRDQNEEEVEEYTVIATKFKNMQRLCDEYENELEGGTKEISDATVLMEEQNYEIDNLLSNIREKLNIKLENR